MKEISKTESLQKTLRAVRRQGRSIGFVPTMGALHEGHASLIRRARRDNDCVVASIFVNPLQFGPHEDFNKYPRPFRQDKDLLRSLKTDYLFSPDAGAFYPEGFVSTVSAGPLGTIFCGKFRPGHFDGVATVVTKLLLAVMPDRVYFGAKDYQQTVVIERLLRDLNFAVKFVRMPTVRDADGLAMSSRNRYLSSEERARAVVLSQTLFWFRDQISSGVTDLKSLRRQALHRLKKTFDQVDYFDAVHPESLRVLHQAQPVMTLLAACRLGKTRLIDNVTITRFQKNT